jgi:probable addiction module antidote protein
MRTTRFDVAEYLDSPKALADYLDAAMEDGDPAVIATALGNIARARGMTQMAKDSGIKREALYRALSPEGNPEFVTVVKVMSALGLRLAPVPIERAKPAKARGKHRQQRRSAA